MHAHEIEKWALSLIGRVKAGQPIEDHCVELKAEWPEPDRAARRIAGHANAALGDPILWLIGVDEEQGVVGACRTDLASWWPQVKAEFSELAPDITDVNIDIDGQTAVALLFDTERAPFVVRNPYYGQAGGGHVQWEVPWREGTRVCSARRTDLERVLQRLQMLPGIEFRGGKLRLAIMFSRQSPSAVQLVPQLELTLYVMPKRDRPVTIPYHRCQVHIEIRGHLPRCQLEPVKMHCEPGPNLHCSATELHARGAGQFNLATAKWIGPMPPPQIPDGAKASVALQLWVAEAGRPAALNVEVPVEVVRGHTTR